MARRKGFDEEWALEQAMNLFWRQGYEATSVRDLINGLGISSSSLYATFGDKRDVYLAALARYRHRELDQVRLTLAESASARETIGRFFMGLIDALLADETQRGSFTLNAAVERGAIDQDVAEQLRRHFDDLTDLLADFLAGAQSRGEIPADHDPEDLARYFLHGLYSLATVARLYPDRERMIRIAGLTMSALDAAPAAVVV